MNSISPGQRIDEQVEDTSETLYGSEGWMTGQSSEPSNQVGNDRGRQRRMTVDADVRRRPACWTPDRTGPDG